MNFSNKEVIEDNVSTTIGRRSTSSAISEQREKQEITK